MTTSIRSKIRSQIRPFAATPTYPTGWGGDLTFKQIADEIAPIMARILPRFGLRGQDIPDSVQTGLMKLWMRLSGEPELLADDACLRAAWRGIALCGCGTMVSQNRRYEWYSEIEDNTGLDVDEYAVHGDAGRIQIWGEWEHWAGFATQTDVQIDLTQAINAIAERYADDITGLVALYILTTDAKPLPTIAAHNLPTSSVYARIDQIRERLHKLLAEYRPAERRSWLDRFNAGEIAPYLEVVAHYEDRPLALAAIYTLSTCAKVRHFVRDEDERRRVTQYRRAVQKRLEAAYGQAASF